VCPLPVAKDEDVGKVIVTIKKIFIVIFINILEIIKLSLINIYKFWNCYSKIAHKANN